MVLILYLLTKKGYSKFILMKLFLSIICFVNILFIIPVVCFPFEPISINEALRKGKILIEIEDLGGSTGDCLVLYVKKNTKENMDIFIPVGTVFKSKTQNIQNMIAYKVKGIMVDEKRYLETEYITLSSDLTYKVLVEAYCLDFQKDNPNKESRFDISGINKSSKCIILYGKKNGANNNVIQSAIWMHRENITDDALKKRFPVNSNEITLARKILAISYDSSRLGGCLFLHDAVKELDYAKVRRLIKTGVNIDEGNDIGVTPLHWAVIRGDSNILKLLIQNGADINSKDKYDHMPIHKTIVTKQNGAILAEILLKKGCIVNSEKIAPLHLTAGAGNIPIAKLLIKFGADIDIIDKDGRSPLFWASAAGEGPTVRFLIENGAKISVKDLAGKDAKFYANQAGHSDVVELIDRLIKSTQQLK